MKVESSPCQARLTAVSDHVATVVFLMTFCVLKDAVIEEYNSCVVTSLKTINLNMQAEELTPLTAHRPSPYS